MVLHQNVGWLVGLFVFPGFQKLYATWVLEMAQKSNLRFEGQEFSANEYPNFLIQKYF